MHRTTSVIFWSTELHLNEQLFAIALEIQKSIISSKSIPQNTKAKLNSQTRRSQTPWIMNPGDLIPTKWGYAPKNSSWPDPNLILYILTKRVVCIYHLEKKNHKVKKKRLCFLHVQNYIAFAKLLSDWNLRTKVQTEPANVYVIQ